MGGCNEANSCCANADFVGNSGWLAREFINKEMKRETGWKRQENYRSQ